MALSNIDWWEGLWQFCMGIACDHTGLLWYFTHTLRLHVPNAMS